ncbi:DUF4136 domain-containing protein [Zhouia sp. PK063]|uniref:DUF4136 domain-containing protein n=1 Tax=Zhouia sp. PK063 TaxID=3373602 RepID=UPI0037ADEE58
MMKKLFILCSVFLFAACASINVDYDYDTKVDFSTYKTYNTYPEMNSGLSELDEDRLLDALDENLQQTKGFQVADAPDVFINISSSLYQQDHTNTVGVGVGGGGNHVGGGISIGLPIGQPKINRVIVFDMIDARTKTLLWQAKSKVFLKPNLSAEEKTALFKKVIDKVFSGYPPSNQN